MEADGVTPGPFEVTVTAYRCRCGHVWLGRDALEPEPQRPSVCPKCKAVHWDKPRRWSRKGKAAD